MSAQQQYYPRAQQQQHYPPPPPQQQQQQHHQQQQHYAPPPTSSPPANQYQYTPPPVSPPAAQHQYGAPPAHQAQSYPLPPQPSPGHPVNYPPPPAAGQPTPSPQPPHQPTPQQHYAPPPATPPAHQGQPSPQHPQQQQQQQQYHPQQTAIPLRPAASPDVKQPPQYDAPPAFPDAEAPYPPEKAGHHEQPLDTSNPVNLQAGAPPAGHFVGAGAVVDDVGTFNGGSYRISHRDTNTILTVQLAMGCPFDAKPGAMVAMSPTMTLRGTVKFSVKKMIAGADLNTSSYIGPGELLLAPPMLGDITSIRLSGNENWSVGHDAYLASTQGVIKDHKRQGLSKAMFSGEGLFVYKMSGTGIMWLTSFGAIIRKDLVDGEKYIVDNGHLVAWNTKYVLERVASGGIISNFASGEGLVCKFTGPGSIFIQTRNSKAFAAYMGGQTVQALAQQDGTGYAKPARRSSSLAAEPPLASKAARGGSSPTSVAKKHGPDSQRASCKLTEAMKNPNWRDRGPDGGSSSSANVSTDESHALGLSSAGSRRWGWVSSSSGDSYVIVEPDNINNRKISPADRRYHARQSVDAPPPSPASTWVPGQHDGEPDANGLLEILVQLKLDDSSAEDSGLFVFEVADRDQSISAAKATGNSSNSCVRIERGPISLVPTQAEQGGPSRFYTSVARELGINGAHRANVSGHTGAKEPHRGRSSHYRAGNGGIFQGVPGTDRARHSMRSSGLSSSYTTRTTDASTSQSNASETHLSPQHRPTSGNLILPNVRDSNLNVCLPRAEDEARAGLDAKNEAFQRMLNKLKKPAQTRLPMQGLGNIDHRISPGHGAVIQERSRLTHHDSGQDDGSE
ncbi:DUF124 domain-containing protein [Purpureocillium lavendulum]|uniref:Altered inheritance of mitochondria protein 24, mitochondrial n=1 Tax=Purpureocillium lavendulum TaxID=1247861 RepID=A0AB34FVB1_9HYPO|nr:DUF124 domain-containing protein [Purpureocillium lavendulum]